MTHALLLGSPAIDTVPAGQCVLASDQRGVARPQVNGCDSGAFELEASDEDNDGVDGSIEASAPNGGDGNYDDIPEAEQSNVTSLPNAINGAYVTVAAPDGVNLTAVEATEVPLLHDMPDASFPIGLVGFTIEGLTPGAAVDVILFLENAVDINSYYKYGRPNPAFPAMLYAFGYNGATGAEILSDRIILHLVDGLRGDDDLTANGTIVDPSGPALVTNTAPAVNTDNATVAANEGETATNSGTVSDVDGDAVVLSATKGTVTDHGDGTWSWSYDV